MKGPPPYLGRGAFFTNSPNWDIVKGLDFLQNQVMEIRKEVYDALVQVDIT